MQLLKLVHKEPSYELIRTRANGNRTVNLVPRPAEPDTLNVPSSATARSRMPMRPTESESETRFWLIPLPLSVTVKMRCGSFLTNVTLAPEAAAWRATFVSASWAIRKIATLPARLN